MFHRDTGPRESLADMWPLSYWVWPIISGIVWLITLLTLLLYWIVEENSRFYPSMSSGQTIAYISDVGAYRLKPLFIAGCAISAIFLNLSIFADRWLRSKGRLVPNASIGGKILTILSIIFSIVGGVGWILLAVFDTYNYTDLHRLFLALFIAGYLLSAIFICWQYQRLGSKNRGHRALYISFWVKLAFIVVELGLAIGFGMTMRSGVPNHAAILEWVIAVIFSFYIFSFAADLWPAVRTKRHEMRFRKSDVANPAIPGSGSDSRPDSDFSMNGFDMTEQGLGVRPGAPHSTLPLTERNTAPNNV
ncbi:hypothetical protein SODALDRAFT_31312 [Sodiomyces alkalinus F11]|uniref:CWH43-like N-terminal domain-containing protein n=1 Tax=Sodiomyces alkalinus (strain CBS 110278 / VKM F-3762 / F11) TaxID=1314773 RepID=A0A3N2Q927_SODAK|nr:hypothetical protein SODALDRAFT_31312 [Sodiomyces alkalinus F11]ROT43125.1 hypothetical protein SODALDRAFT_31312 [Sodiomyces alkalinus F11]